MVHAAHLSHMSLDACRRFTLSTSGNKRGVIEASLYPICGVSTGVCQDRGRWDLGCRFDPAPSFRRQDAMRADMQLLTTFSCHDCFRTALDDRNGHTSRPRCLLFRFSSRNSFLAPLIRLEASVGLERGILDVESISYN